MRFASPARREATTAPGATVGSMNMSDLKVLTAAFIMVPFLALLTYPLPSDRVVVGTEVLLVGGVFAIVLSAALFVISTVLAALGGGSR